MDWKVGHGGLKNDPKQFFSIRIQFSIQRDSFCEMGQKSESLTSPLSLSNEKCFYLAEIDFRSLPALLWFWSRLLLNCSEHILSFLQLLIGSGYQVDWVIIIPCLLVWCYRHARRSGNEISCWIRALFYLLYLVQILALQALCWRSE